MSCPSHFQTCSILLPSCQKTLASLLQYLTTTSYRTIPTILEKRPVARYHDLTWSLPVKMEIFQVHGHRVGFTAKETGNTAGQDVRGNQQGCYSSRQVMKIKVSTDTPTEFELGDTAADIQRRREEREQREREEVVKQ